MVKFLIKKTQIIKYIFIIILSIILDFCFLKALSLFNYEEWLLKIKEIFEIIINSASLSNYIRLAISVLVRLFSIIGIIMICLSFIPNMIIDVLGFNVTHLPKTEKEMIDERKEQMFNEEITDIEETYKKNKYTIRMEVTMDRDMSYEEAETVIFNALRSAGMKGHKGGIS